MWSPNKVPHGLKQSMAQAFGIPKEKIRVNPVSIGGDFGGKGAPIDEPICYLLALRSRRPVKMVMEYREEFFAGAPRHAGASILSGTTVVPQCMTSSPLSPSTAGK